jgi:tRNA pseudouridine55 synthase
LIVDKPVGPTSFAVVRQIRSAFGVRKVGHGGTLDPLASGVLPVCLGEATKLAQFLLDADKEYLATIQFGAETETDDRAGAVTATHPVDHLREADVAAAVEAFRGARTQIPPMFSALKHHGRPLYDYARAGEVIARDARHIEILEFELLAYRPDPTGEAGAVVPLTPGPAVDVRVRCSKGTYIRTLARDLGAALGSGAHLAALRRTRSGPFDLGRAVRLEQLQVQVGGAQVGASMFGALISPADALCDMPAVRLTAELERIVSQGKSLTWDRLGAFPEPGPEGLGRLTRLLGPGGALVAVARRAAPGERVRTLRVFATGGPDAASHAPSGQAANPEV